MPQRIQFELVRKRALARKQPFTLQIAVHDEDRRRIVAQVTANCLTVLLSFYVYHKYRPAVSQP